jgi:hypothetical protein
MDEKQIQEVEILQSPKSEQQTTTETIARSIIPYDRQDNRGRYLGYRSSGFSISEALSFLKVTHSALSFWRTNQDFVDLERRIPEFRRTLAAEYAQMEFMRNFRLVMQKDYDVLWKAVWEPNNMSPFEREYCIKVRAQYTPQQLQIMNALAGENAGSEFDFTKMVMSIQRETNPLSNTIRVVKQMREEIVTHGNSPTDSSQTT